MTRTVSDILAARRPPERTLRLSLDGGLAARIAELEAEIRQAKVADMLAGGGLDDRAPGLERELAELKVQADEASEVFRFRAIGRLPFAEITRRYPPSAEQWDRYRQEAAINPFTANAPEYDIEAMAPEVIAACCVEPEMTVDEARRLWDELTDSQAAALFEAAWAVNQEPSSRPSYGIGTDTTPTSDPGSTTPPNGASPSASSPAGS